MFSSLRQGYFLIFLCGCSSLVGFALAEEENDPDAHEEPGDDFEFEGIEGMFSL